VPTITQSGSILQSSSATGNQWYLDGVALLGATASSYTPSQSGQYTVTVTANGCKSAPSAPFNFLVTAINSPLLDNQIRIVPNPVHDYLNIQYNGNPAVFKLRLVDLNGSELMQKTFTGSTLLDLRKLTAGVYVVNIANVRNGEHVKQLIIKF